jgi:hypothetical protein
MQESERVEVVRHALVYSDDLANALSGYSQVGDNQSVPITAPRFGRRTVVHFFECSFRAWRLAQVQSTRLHQLGPPRDSEHRGDGDAV